MSRIAYRPKRHYLRSLPLAEKWNALSTYPSESAAGWGALDALFWFLDRAGERRRYPLSYPEWKLRRVAAFRRAARSAKSLGDLGSFFRRLARFFDEWGHEDESVERLKQIIFYFMEQEERGLSAPTKALLLKDLKRIGFFPTAREKARGCRDRLKRDLDLLGLTCSPPANAKRKVSGDNYHGQLSPVQPSAAVFNCECNEKAAFKSARRTGPQKRLRRSAAGLLPIAKERARRSLFRGHANILERTRPALAAQRLLPAGKEPRH